MGIQRVGTVDVNVQDPHTAPFLGYLHKHLQSDLTFATYPSVGDWSITLNAGHGYTVAGEGVYLYQPNINYQIIKTTSVVGNVIGLDAMIDYPYSSGVVISRTTEEMAVDGDPTRQEFHIFAPGLRQWDVTGMKLFIVSSGEPDDSKFGDIAALLRGVNIHLLVAEGVPFSLGTYHTNGDFLKVGDVTYSTKGGGGKYATRVDIKLREAFGVTIRMRGTATGLVYPYDELKVVISDDIDGLESFTANLYGHTVQ